jgi:hypothetical protein
MRSNACRLNAAALSECQALQHASRARQRPIWTPHAPHQRRARRPCRPRRACAVGGCRDGAREAGPGAARQGRAGGVASGWAGRGGGGGGGGGGFLGLVQAGRALPAPGPWGLAGSPKALASPRSAASAAARAFTAAQGGAARANDTSRPERGKQSSQVKTTTGQDVCGGLQLDVGQREALPRRLGLALPRRRLLCSRGAREGGEGGFDGERGGGVWRGARGDSSPRESRLQPATAAPTEPACRALAALAGHPLRAEGGGGAEHAATLRSARPRAISSARITLYHCFHTESHGSRSGSPRNGSGTGPLRPPRASRWPAEPRDRLPAPVGPRLGPVGVPGAARCLARHAPPDVLSAEAPVCEQQH